VAVAHFHQLRLLNTMQVGKEQRMDELHHLSSLE
jgi:hypothetical protein